MTADTAPHPLRVGILIDSCTQPAWVYRAIEAIRDSGAAELALIVRNTAKPAARPLLAKRHHLVQSLYERLDRALFREAGHALEPRDITPLIEGIPLLDVMPRQTEHSDHFEDADLAAIRAHDLDVAIRFGFRILRGGALSIARHGVWSYHHGDDRTRRGGPAGFWELAEHEPGTSAVLQVLSEALDGGRILARTRTRTDPVSLDRSRNRLYWKSAPLAARALARLHRSGAAVEPNTYTPYCEPLGRVPTNAQMLGIMARVAVRAVKTRLANRFTREQWFVAYRFRKNADDPNNALYGFRHIVPPRDRIWADPFVINRNGRAYIFVEELWFGSPAHISVIEVARGEEPTPARPVLERPYHVSYPCVFEWNGDDYMVPESEENGTVDLYRAIEFPDRWELAATLMTNVRAVDPTMFEHDGRWWLFLTMRTPGSDLSDELSMLHAPSPFGPWTPHALNPVDSDVIGGRSAGRPFRYDGRLYRAVQDGAVRYGHSMRVHEIVKLTPDEYEWREVAAILPRWAKKLAATHTYNVAGDITVIDGMRYIPRIS